MQVALCSKPGNGRKGWGDGCWQEPCETSRSRELCALASRHFLPKGGSYQLRSIGAHLAHLPATDELKSVELLGLAVLIGLERNPGLSVAELQNQTGAPESHIVALLEKLKQQGWVRSNRGAWSLSDPPASDHA